MDQLIDEKIRLAFYDVDGTLAAPVYVDDQGKAVVGFTDEEWMDFCKQKGESSYEHCLVVPQIRDYALEEKKRGVRLFVLTASCCEEETRGKERFLEKYYPGLFEEVLSVEHEKEKVEVIRRMAREASVGLEECELVEDTFSTVLSAHVAGIRAVHISNILSGQIPG